MASITEDFPDAIPTDIAARLGIDQSGGRFSSVVMGARTHSMGLPDMPSPYRHLEQVVFTHRDLEPEENLTITDADPVEVVREMKRHDGGDIRLCGGANLAAQLRGEIDRLVLKRQPLLFGSGIPLFAPSDYDPARFDRVSAQDYDSGVSITHCAPRLSTRLRRGCPSCEHPRPGVAWSARRTLHRLEEHTPLNAPPP